MLAVCIHQHAACSQRHSHFILTVYIFHTWCYQSMSLFHTTLRHYCLQSISLTLLLAAFVSHTWYEQSLSLTHDAISLQLSHMLPTVITLKHDASSLYFTHDAGSLYLLTWLISHLLSQTTYVYICLSHMTLAVFCLRHDASSLYLSHDSSSLYLSHDASSLYLLKILQSGTSLSQDDISYITHTWC
jgi:hypothetical protein